MAFKSSGRCEYWLLSWKLENARLVIRKKRASSLTKTSNHGCSLQVQVFWTHTSIAPFFHVLVDIITRSHPSHPSSLKAFFYAVCSSTSWIPQSINIMITSYLLLNLLTLASTSPPIFRRELANCSLSFGVPGHVYICPSPHFQQPKTCQWSPGNVCMAVRRPEDWPRSVGPDPGGRCYFFPDHDCKGKKAILTIVGTDFEWVVQLRSPLGLRRSRMTFEERKLTSRA